MNNAELKEALLSKEPVIYTDRYGHEAEYGFVSGIIYRERDGRIVVTAEIADKSSNSRTICEPERIRTKDHGLQGEQRG